MVVPQTDGHLSSGGRGTQVEKSASQVTCRVCGHVATDADDLRSHLLATHGHELEEFRAVHLCARCGRRFASKASLVHHMNAARHHHAGVTSLRRHSSHLSLRHRRQLLSQVSCVIQCVEIHDTTVYRCRSGRDPPKWLAGVRSAFTPEK